MPGTRRDLLTIGAALVANALAGCGPAPEADDPGAASGAVEAQAELPAPPPGGSIDSRHLPNDVYKAVCRLGSPVLLDSAPTDAAGLSLVFTGPFGQGDAETRWDYLSVSIEALDRRWVAAIRRLNHSELEVIEPNPQALERFQLPRIAGIKPSIHLVRQDLGDPALIRDVKGGQQRYIFDRKFCLGDQLLEGMYLDVERARVVKARGIEHPNELKWILSGGRPPGPDPEPTRYLDVRPADGSPQSVALGFVRRREMQDPESARALVGEDDLLSVGLADMLDPTRPGARIDDSTLTYQTTLFGHDETHVTVRYQLLTDAGGRFDVVDRQVLRKHGDAWQVVESNRRP